MNTVQTQIATTAKTPTPTASAIDSMSRAISYATSRSALVFVVPTCTASLAHTTVAKAIPVAFMIWA